MKKWIIIIGTVLFLVGLFQGGRFLMDYNSLTQYGKGYVWGSGLLMLLGFFLILIGVKKKKKTSP